MRALLTALISLGLAASPDAAQSVLGNAFRSPQLPISVGAYLPGADSSLAAAPSRSGITPSPVTPRKIAEVRQDPCDRRSSRTFGGVVVGVLVGGSIGVVHGLAGHPGLPHTGMDAPDVLEYSPLFALTGGIIGGIVAAGPPCA